MGILELLQLQRKTFLKASRSEGSAPLALEGLGTWGLMPTFLRYSHPLWACTFSKPFLCSIQRATLGPLHIPPPHKLALAPTRAPREAPAVRPRRATPSAWRPDFGGGGRPEPPLPARCNGGLSCAPSRDCSQ